MSSAGVEVSPSGKRREILQPFNDIVPGHSGPVEPTTRDDECVHVRDSTGRAVKIEVRNLMTTFIINHLVIYLSAKPVSWTPSAGVIKVVETTEPPKPPPIR